MKRKTRIISIQQKSSNKLSKELPQGIQFPPRRLLLFPLPLRNGTLVQPCPSGQLLLRKSECRTDGSEPLAKGPVGIVGSVSQEIDHVGDQANFRLVTVRLPVVNALLGHPNLDCHIPLEQPQIQPFLTDMIA